MGIFGSVSSKQVDEFAVGLARVLARECPPEPGKEGGGRPTVSPRKLVATLEEICREALSFHTLHKLGVYKKARLGNAFRWELTSLGYDNAFVEDVTRRLVVHIARKR